MAKTSPEKLKQLENEKREKLRQLIMAQATASVFYKKSKAAVYSEVLKILGWPYQTFLQREYGKEARHVLMMTQVGKAASILIDVELSRLLKQLDFPTTIPGKPSNGRNRTKKQVEKIVRRSRTSKELSRGKTHKKKKAVQVLSHPSRRKSNDVRRRGVSRKATCRV